MGIDGAVDLSYSASSYKRRVLHGHDAQVFLHTYQTIGLSVPQLLADFQPVKHKVSPAPTYALYSGTEVEKHRLAIQSAKEVIDLYLQHVAETGQAADLVVLSRFNLMFRTDVVPQLNKSQRALVSLHLDGDSQNVDLVGCRRLASLKAVSAALGEALKNPRSTLQSAIIGAGQPFDALQSQEHWEKKRIYTWSARAAEAHSTELAQQVSSHFKESERDAVLTDLRTMRDARLRRIIGLGRFDTSPRIVLMQRLLDLLKAKASADLPASALMYALQ